MSPAERKKLLFVAARKAEEQVLGKPHLQLRTCKLTLENLTNARQKAKVKGFFDTRLQRLVYSDLFCKEKY
ncbi:hypothetical protein JCM1840_002267 [Sporobolomyces johnsonii]